MGAKFVEKRYFVALCLSKVFPAIDNYPPVKDEELMNLTQKPGEKVKATPCPSS